MERALFEEHAAHGTADFPVGIYDMSFERGEEMLFSVHYHKEFELLLVTKGAIRLQLEGDTFCLNSGEGVFINSGTLHSAVSAQDGECGFIAVVFSPEFIAERYEGLYGRYILPVIKNELCVPRALTEDMSAIIRETNELFKSHGFGCELFIKSNLARITAMCVERAKRNYITENGNKTDIVKNVLDYIRLNYAGPITLRDMSAHVHISREHLCRVFKEVSELPPVVYLNRYRVMQSAYMLRAGNKSISEIASDCGFNNSSYFDRQFMRFMKCTPGEYRRIWRDSTR